MPNVAKIGSGAIAPAADFHQRTSEASPRWCAGKFAERFASATPVVGPLRGNPTANLKAKGHPPGTSGVAQCVELLQQIRSEVHEHLGGARIALAHNSGGSAAVSTMTILEGSGTNGG